MKGGLPLYRVQPMRLWDGMQAYSLRVVRPDGSEQEVTQRLNPISDDEAAKIVQEFLKPQSSLPRVIGEAGAKYGRNRKRTPVESDDDEG
jgi:hypothetical protein